MLSTPKLTSICREIIDHIQCWVSISATFLRPKKLFGSGFSTDPRDLEKLLHWRICSREQRKQQLDWLATNTDDITSQSHSLFGCSREKNRQVENRLICKKMFEGTDSVFNTYSVPSNISYKSIGRVFLAIKDPSFFTRAEIIWCMIKKQYFFPSM
jgi:hypothetical protein